MGDKDRAGASPPLTVALDVPSAQLLADQAAVIQDLQFVMESCRRLLAELARPEAERDAVVPLALWSAALVAYARCFSSGQRFGLTTDDLLSLPLQGEVMKFHAWVVEERNHHTRHRADPFEVARVGVALAPAEAGAARRVTGITVLATRHVLVDDTGVRQLGLDHLCRLPALPVRPPGDPAGEP
jgi:hypothetical protein